MYLNPSSLHHESTVDRPSTAGLRLRGRFEARCRWGFAAKLLALELSKCRRLTKSVGIKLEKQTKTGGNIIYICIYIIFIYIIIKYIIYYNIINFGPLKIRSLPTQIQTSAAELWMILQILADILLGQHEDLLGRQGRVTILIEPSTVQKPTSN